MRPRDPFYDPETPEERELRRTTEEVNRLREALADAERRLQVLQDPWNGLLAGQAHVRLGKVYALTFKNERHVYEVAR